MRVLLGRRLIPIARSLVAAGLPEAAMTVTCSRGLDAAIIICNADSRY
ncbi:MAG: hypothetical protein ACJAY5_000457 [Actinomycetes bacterium]|jgi:hypothetical protein